MTYQNPLRRKLDQGGLVLATMLRLPDPSAAEIMASAGVDMICIDNEHYPFDVRSVEAIARGAQIHGASVLIRVPNDEPARIAQMLDCGLQGIKIPHVETKEQAQAIVDAVMYAPQGNRGFCPITRAASYGLDAAPTQFTQESNREMVIALMVETKTGLENIDDILSIPEVDIIAIGPSDVSASYGLPGQPDHPIVKAAIDKARVKIAASGKFLCALVKNEEQAWQEIKAGTRVFLIGSDLQMLTGGFSSLVQEIQNSLPAAEV